MPKKQARQWFNFSAISETVAKLEIFGEIGWEVDGAQFTKELNAIKAERIEVEINSPGGGVFGGMQIHNALLAHPAAIDITITGIAASIASFIVVAGDSIKMYSASMLMIHNPHTYSSGTADDHEKTAEALRKIEEILVKGYMRRFTGAETEIRDVMNAETWYTPDDALAAGFCDEIVEVDLDIAACLKDFDLSVFAKVPDELKPSEQNSGASLDTRTTAPAVVATAGITSAQTTNGEHNMPTPEEIKAAADKAAQERETARLDGIKEGQTAEVNRQKGIRAIFEPHPGHEDILAQCLADVSVTDAKASALLLAALGATNKPTQSPATVLVDARDKFRAGAEQGILMRIGAVKRDFSNEFTGRTLFELVRASLDIAGVNYSGRSKEQILALSLNQPGSDFPALIASVANKQVMRGYDEANEAYQVLARIGNLSDFKVGARSGLSAAPSLVLNTENQEVKTLQLGDRTQSIQLATYAGRFGLSRQAIINDDLGEFSRLGAKFGASARRTVGDQFAAQFTANSGLGSTLDEDSKTIFHADHNNSTSGVPTTASFSTFRKLMGVQTDVKSVANLNIEPKYIYAPKALEGACLVVNKSEKEVVSAKTATTPNTEMGRWEIVTDSRLDTASALKYYGLADPNRYDTVEVAFLDGNDAPTVIEAQTTDVLGLQYVMWIDCVAQALDFRTMTYSTGA